MFILFWYKNHDLLKKSPLTMVKSARGSHRKGGQGGPLWGVDAEFKRERQVKSKVGLAVFQMECKVSCAKFLRQWEACLVGGMGRPVGQRKMGGVWSTFHTGWNARERSLDFLLCVMESLQCFKQDDAVILSKWSLWVLCGRWMSKVKRKIGV